MINSCKFAVFLLLEFFRGFVEVMCGYNHKLFWGLNFCSMKIFIIILRYPLFCTAEKKKFWPICLFSRTTGVSLCPSVVSLRASGEVWICGITLFISLLSCFFAYGQNFCEFLLLPFTTDGVLTLRGLILLYQSSTEEKTRQRINRL